MEDILYARTQNIEYPSLRRGLLHKMGYDPQEIFPNFSRCQNAENTRKLFISTWKNREHFRSVLGLSVFVDRERPDRLPFCIMSDVMGYTYKYVMLYETGIRSLQFVCVDICRYYLPIWKFYAESCQKLNLLVCFLFIHW